MPSSLSEICRQIATTCFDLAAPPEVKTSEDPEWGETWEQVRIQVRGSATTVQDAHGAYTNAWLNLVPAERARDVRLAIRIVSISESTARREDL
jgi:hypothetical protein